MCRIVIYIASQIFMYGPAFEEEERRTKCIPLLQAHRSLAMVGYATQPLLGADSVKILIYQLALLYKR